MFTKASICSKTKIWQTLAVLLLLTATSAASGNLEQDNSPDNDPFIGERINPQEQKIFAEKKVSLWPFH